jgi:hypothetical protein
MGWLEGNGGKAVSRAAGMADGEAPKKLAFKLV